MISVFPPGQMSCLALLVNFETKHGYILEIQVIHPVVLHNLFLSFIKTSTFMRSLFTGNLGISQNVSNQFLKGAKMLSTHDKALLFFLRTS